MEMAFPPYRLLDRDYLEIAQDKLGRVERLYHVGQRNSWDGKEVLAELVRKHAPSGRLQVSDADREVLAGIFTPIMWGELAAWNVAADLALHLGDVEAKMAATSQTFDEARHFYVLRDYLLLLGVELPPLDGFSQTVLRDLLETGDLVEKLLGMQLIVENTAVVLFRGVAQARLEPVLSGLLPYLERDEARHVGLGVLYLPRLLGGISGLRSLRLLWSQFKIAALLGWATQRNRQLLARVGLEPHAALVQGFRLQTELVQRMRAENPEAPIRGLIFGTSGMDRFHSTAIDLFFPPAPAQAGLPWWHRGVIGLCDRVARLAEPALRS